MSGKLIILSAPSGSGKTTIVRHLLTKFPDLGFSISCCTRDPRDGEKDGQHYYFLSEEEFLAHRDNNDFVEWEEVYRGSYYGTLKAEVERLWAEGKTVIFDVDVKGGLKLKEYYKEKALSVYVFVSDLDQVKERLMKRGTESEESLKKRIDKMKEESAYQHHFDVLLHNDDLSLTLRNAEIMAADFIGKQEN